MAVSANALTTLDNVKDFYGISTALTTDDDLLEDLIDRVTESIESYCNVTHFKQNDYVEYQDGEGSKYLFVNNVPILSVDSIADDSDWIWAADSTLGTDEYRILDSKYLILKADLFAVGDQNIQINFYLPDVSISFKNYPKEMVAINDPLYFKLNCFQKTFLQ